MNKLPLQLRIADTDRTVLKSNTTLAQLEQVNWQQVSCLLIDASDITAAYTMLGQLRQHSEPAVYLRPVVFVTPGKTNSDWRWQAADAVVLHQGDTLFDSEKLPDALKTINNWIEKLPVVKSGTDGHLQIKLLRLLASRQAGAEPVTTSDNFCGYVTL